VCVGVCVCVCVYVCVCVCVQRDVFSHFSDFTADCAIAAWEFDQTRLSTVRGLACETSLR